MNSNRDLAKTQFLPVRPASNHWQWSFSSL